MAYIGKAPVNGFHSKQTLSTDGSTVTFTLDFTVADETALIVVVGGVIQEPKSAFNLAAGGTQITFTAAPASTDTAYIQFLGQAIVQNLLDLSGGELILDADNDTTITADTDDQIDIKIAGADDFQFTANDFTALSGSVISTDTINETTSGSGVTIDSVICKDGTIDVQGNNDAIILDADGDTTISANTDDKIDFEIAGTNQIQFDDNGRILVTHTQSANIGGAECKVQVQGTTTETSSLSLKNNQASSAAPTLRFGKSRGTSVNSHTIVADGDELGVIVFSGADGVDQTGQSCVIISEIGGGTPGENDTPGKFKIGVAADGANTTTIRFHMDTDGTLTATDTSIGSLSDSRLKENISDYTYPIDTFKQFAPKTFTWKNPEMHKSGTQRGFLGQDIESTDSYWAKEEPISPKQGTQDGPDNPDYDIISNNIAKVSKLTEKDAMYISVIKQLIARIEALES